MTDQEIEAAVRAAGGQWDGNVWRFEDADIHPFVRSILAAPPAASTSARPDDALEKLRFVRRVMSNYATAPESDRADAYRMVCDLFLMEWHAQAPVVPATDARGEPESTGDPSELLRQIRALADEMKRVGPGVLMPVPKLVAEEGRKFMRGEPSLFDRLPIGDVTAATSMLETAALAATQTPAVPATDARAEWTLDDIPPAPPSLWPDGCSLGDEPGCPYCDGTGITGDCGDDGRTIDVPCSCAALTQAASTGGKL